MKTRTIKTYSELIKIPTFEGRIRYLELHGKVGVETFGGHRELNQMFYRAVRWRSIRNGIILRDGGFDLAHPDHEITGSIYIHHLNPITTEDILDSNPIIWNPENLVSVSFETHSQIHYGFERKTPPVVTERKPGDTLPWNNATGGLL